MAYIPPSELIINSDGSVFHLHMKPCQLADNVILMGDPGRVQTVGAFFDKVTAQGGDREFRFITGERKGVPFTAMSTGIGTDNIDIVLTELDALANIDFQKREPYPVHRRLNILRIGTSGALQEDIPLGTLVYSRFSLGFDGLLNWYGKRQAICDTDYEAAFCAHTGWPELLPAPYFVPACPPMEALFARLAPVHGITISAPGFYGPQGRTLRIPLAAPHLMDKLVSFSYQGNRICNFEMEGAALAGLSRHLGHYYGTVCQVVSHRNKLSVNVDYKSLMKTQIEQVLDLLCKADFHG